MFLENTGKGPLYLGDTFYGVVLSLNGWSDSRVVERREHEICIRLAIILSLIPDELNKL